MSSVLVPASFYVTVIVGPLQIASVLGYFLLRRHPAFAVRGPLVVLGLMFMKLISFFCISWLFLHPETPCMFASIMMWVDFSAHIISVGRKVVLLFRFEIQAALEQTKLDAKVFDESNFFVRYRQILRPRVQVSMMFGCLAWVGLPLLAVAIVFHHEAATPCVTASIADNKFVLSSIITAFLSLIPAVTLSFWSARRLRNFPLDNWKIGVESSIFSTMSWIYCFICIIILSVIPTFDGILFLFFCFSICTQFVTLFTPLQLQRGMVKQLAHMDLDKLASLRRLLQDADFLANFDAFLRKEFSSENLAFWLEMNKLQDAYGTLFPERGTEFASSVSLSPKSASKEVHSVPLRKVAEDCRALVQQYIGDNAPCQINVSGFTGDDLAKAVKDVNEQLALPESDAVEEQLAQVVEEALKILSEAQKEVYESLRKDSYPRFLLSSAAKKLNQNEHFKRLLAAERLEGDMRKTNTDTKESSKSSASEQAPPQKLSSSRRSCEVPFPRLTLGAPAGPDFRRSSFGSTGGSAEKDGSIEPELDIVVAFSDAAKIRGGGGAEKGSSIEMPELGIVASPDASKIHVDAEKGSIEMPELDIVVASPEASS